MSWVLALYIYSSPDVFTKEFSTELECVKEMRKVAALSEHKNDKDIKKITCEKVIVLSESD